MKKFNVPIVVIAFFYIVNIIFIIFLGFNTKSLDITEKIILLVPLAIVTLTLFSIGDFYNWMMLVENRKFRFAIVIILRGVFLIGSLAAEIGSIYYFVVFYDFSNLLVASFIGYLFTDIFYTSYIVLGILTLGYSGAYRTSPDNIYRLQLLATKNVFDKEILKFDNMLEEYALGVTDDLCLIYFTEVVDKTTFPNKDKEYYTILTGAYSIIFRKTTLGNYYKNEFIKTIQSHGRKINDLAIIAKPFALLFPDKIEVFRKYSEKKFKGKMKKTAFKLISEMEKEIPENFKQSGITERIEKLKPIMKIIKDLRVLIQNSDEFDIEEVMKTSNLDKDEIINISGFLDRDVYEDKLLTNTKYLAVLKKIV